MERNIAALNKAEEEAQKRYRELNRLLEREMQARNWMIRDLKYHWLWVLAIAMIGGFFGVKQADNVTFEDWLA